MEIANGKWKSFRRKIAWFSITFSSQVVLNSCGPAVVLQGRFLSTPISQHQLKLLVSSRPFIPQFFVLSFDMAVDVIKQKIVLLLYGNFHRKQMLVLWVKYLFWSKCSSLHVLRYTATDWILKIQYMLQANHFSSNWGYVSTIPCF